MIDKVFELANAAHALEQEGKVIAADEMRAAWARYMLTVFEDAQGMDNGPLKALFDALAPVKE